MPPQRNDFSEDASHYQKWRSKTFWEGGPIRLRAFLPTTIESCLTARFNLERDQIVSELIEEIGISELKNLLKSELSLPKEVLAKIDRIVGEGDLEKRLYIVRRAVKSFELAEGLEGGYHFTWVF